VPQLTFQDFLTHTKVISLFDHHILIGHQTVKPKLLGKLFVMSVSLSRIASLSQLYLIFISKAHMSFQPVFSVTGTFISDQVFAVLKGKSSLNQKSTSQTSGLRLPAIV